MRESVHKLLIPGILFLVLGGVLFVVTENVIVKVEVLPFSFMLILILVAGIILFGSGVLMYLTDRF